MFYKEKPSDKVLALEKYFYSSDPCLRQLVWDRLNEVVSARLKTNSEVIWL